MVLGCSIVAASILVVLILTPVVVEETNKYIEVCLLVNETPLFWQPRGTTCWTSDRKCNDLKIN